MLFSSVFTGNRVVSATDKEGLFALQFPPAELS